MDLPDLSLPMMRRYLPIVSSIVGAILFLALPFVTEVSFHDTVCALALPLVVIGVSDAVFSRSWVRLVFSAALSVLSAFFGLHAFVAVVLLMFGTSGVSCVADAVCRRYVSKVLRDMEHAGDGFARRSALFISGIPEWFDARDMHIASTVKREAVPWNLRSSTVMVSMAPLILLWIFVSSAGVGFDRGIVATMVAILYIAVPAVSLSLLSSMEATVRCNGVELPLYRGIVRTSLLASAPLLLALLLSWIVSMPSASVLWLIAASIVFDVVLVMFSRMFFEEKWESALVRDLHSDWICDHPVGFRSGLDGRSAGRYSDDTVPGTPKRPEDYCFVQRKRSLKYGFARPGEARESKMGLNASPAE